MRAFADCAQAVERGDSESGGEVAVRATANGGFVEVPADFCGDLLRGTEQSHDFLGAFEWRPIDPAADF